MDCKARVLIAGIGGGSLGTEILKCLVMAGSYSVFGCDVSSLAFGHYCEGFEETFLVDRQLYVNSVLASCRERAIEVIIPGGEEPLRLLTQARDRLKEEGIQLAGNRLDLVELYTDKLATFASLARLGFEVPVTVAARNAADLEGMSYPCIVKPGKGGGGSAFAFLAEDRNEALLYAEQLLQNGKTPIVQEYIPADEGEYTIGVLSLADGTLVGSIALQRNFQSKLSVSLRTRAGLISSGHSQGLIDDFSELRSAAEAIAESIRSAGPLNIQGRVRNGRLIPFEINPRFSASTYLRALAGFNEVDIYLQFLIHGARKEPAPLRPGYYLRSFDEVFVSADKVVT